MNPFRYAIWLIPCAESHAVLQQTIDGLASRFGTPSFAPHATLCSGLWKNSEAELMEAVNLLLAKLPVTLSADSIDWVDRWFGFFFVRLAGEGDLFAQAAGQIEGSHLPDIGPHISLLYSFGDKVIHREALRTGLAGRLPETIRFDSLALVRPATGRWEDVESWEILSTYGL